MQSSKRRETKPAPKAEVPEPRIFSEIATSPTSTMTAEEKRHVSVAGARILKHVQQAKERLGEEDVDGARAHIEKGMLLVDIIETVRPSYEVRAKITSGDLVYEDTEEVKASVVPIYEELDDDTVILPVIKASEKAVAAKSEAEKTAYDEAKPKAKDGDNNVELVVKRLPATEESGAEAKVEPALVADADLSFTTVKMDVRRAKTGLELAERFLSAEGDNEEVDALREEIDEWVAKIDGSSDEDSAEQATGWWEKVRGWFK